MKLGKTLANLVLAGILSVSGGNALENKANATPMQITNTLNSYERSYDFSGDWIVYEKSGEGNGTFLHNIRTNEVRDISNHFSTSGWIEGNYMGLVSGTYKMSDVFLYDINNNQFTNISLDMPGKNSPGGISQRKISWVHDEIDDGLNNGDLVVYDINSSTKQIYHGFAHPTMHISGFRGHSSLWDNKFYYTGIDGFDTPNETTFARIFDLDTGLHTSVREYGFNGDGVCSNTFANNYLAYISCNEDELNLYDVTKGTTIIINNQSASFSNLDMFNNILVWDGIYSYDINTGLERRLPNDGSYPIVYEDYVAYTSNGDIYVDRVPEPSTIGLLVLGSLGLAKRKKRAEL